MSKKVVLPNNDGKRTSDAGVTSSKFIEILGKQFPGKINFSINEVAGILNVSYDFVREHILRGLIKATKYGDRWMINLFELVRILEVGV